MKDELEIPHNCIDISYENISAPSWIEDIENFCIVVLKRLDIKNWEVSLLFCDDQFIADLNERYRSTPGPTDVLSFAQIDNKLNHLQDGQSGIIYAGDIIISIPTLLKNVNTLHIDRDEELKRLIIHGMLHLAGMEHKEKGCKMLKLQEKILKDLMGGKS
ncbi:MAG: rRNA maturation RNase YbeY [Candidatus Pacearchaeota archaeon]|nr:rRNA maturation RNase YbeY [Candidatus Pacearchaeota archaeon]